MIPEDVYTSRSGASACEEWVVEAGNAGSRC